VKLVALVFQFSVSSTASEKPMGAENLLSYALVNQMAQRNGWDEKPPTYLMPQQKPPFE